MVKLLVINPNSSQLVTDQLQSVISLPQAEVEYYTAPAPAPKEIVTTNGQLSADVCLKDIRERGLDHGYDGYLVCCFSNHQLVPELLAVSKVPVAGIMDASLIHCTRNEGKAIIITSVSEWEPVLDQGIVDILGLNEFPRDKFYPTKALNLSVLNLGKQENVDLICNKFKQLLPDDVSMVILGCAGMSELEPTLKSSFPNISFVNSVPVGIDILYSQMEKS